MSKWHRGNNAVRKKKLPASQRRNGIWLPTHLSFFSPADTVLRPFPSRPIITSISVNHHGALKFFSSSSFSPRGDECIPTSANFFVLGQERRATGGGNAGRRRGVKTRGVRTPDTCVSRTRVRTACVGPIISPLIPFLGTPIRLRKVSSHPALRQEAFGRPKKSGRPTAFKERKHLAAVTIIVFSRTSIVPDHPTFQNVLPYHRQGML